MTATNEYKWIARIVRWKPDGADASPEFRMSWFVAGRNARYFGVSFITPSLLSLCQFVQ
jgi:hypothetical protein